MLKTVGNPSTRYGDQTIIDGNLVFGTAGKGIDFSANPSAPGMTSELLDDYEEGTFDVTVSGSTSGSGIVPATATYTKIGNQVTVNVSIQNRTFPTYSGTLQLSLPFAAGSTAYGSMVYFYDLPNWSTGADFAGWQAVVGAGDAFAILQINRVNGDRQTFATSANTTTSNTSGLYFAFSLTYFV